MLKRGLAEKWVNFDWEVRSDCEWTEGEVVCYSFVIYIEERIKEVDPYVKGNYSLVESDRVGYEKWVSIHPDKSNL